MKYAMLIIVVAATFVLSCNNAVEPPVVVTYPFAAGNSWNYRAEYSIANFRPTVPGTSNPVASYSWTATVTSLGDTLVKDSTTTSRLSLIESVPNELSPGALGSERYDNFYRLRNDSLCLFAWRFSSGGIPLPKRSPGYFINAQGKQFRNGLELCDQFAGRLYSLPVNGSDTLNYVSPPGPVYVFPFQKGNEWTINSFISMKKKITGAEKISTQAGSFSVYVIEWIWSDGSFPEVKEYISEKGLLKRTFTMKDITITSANSPEVLGLVDIKIEYVVTSLNVP